MSDKDTAVMVLDEVAKELAEITPILQKAFSEAGPTLDMTKVTAFGDGLETGQKSERLAHMNVRMHRLGERKLALTSAQEGKALADEMDAWLKSPRDGSSPAPTGENGTKAYRPFADWALKDRAWVKRSGPEIEIADLDTKTWLEREVKTVVSTGAGYAPQAIRSGVTVPAAFQAPTVVDLIPIIRTDQSAYVYMGQTTRTNAAAEIAESADGSLQSLAESAFVWTQLSETIRKVGHFVPVTDEQIEDIAGFQDLLNTDMLMGVNQRLSSQCLNGAGTGVTLNGILASGRSGVSDVDCTGEFVADAIAKLIEKVQITGYCEPDAGIMHPSDWWGYRRATTADGIYIAGSPSENIPPMMWGKPLALTTEMTQGKAVVGAFRQYSRLAVKRGVALQISSEHASYFIQGVQAVKAEMRAAFILLRETAFAKTDDIVVS
jgi:HK97 family phage major capsid protein